MTRTARPTETTVAIALTANHTPAAGHGAAPRALLSDPLDTKATVTSSQVERRAPPLAGHEAGSNT